MCNSVIFKDSFSIRYIPDQYKTQQMLDEAVDNCLDTLKFSPDCFVTSKMLEKLDNALHAYDDILFYNEILIKSHLLLNQIHNSCCRP